MEKYDFSGWATRVNVKCSDGRVIQKDAFKHCDGAVVPLVWNHRHSEVHNVLGHALLENRDEGVYAYGYFNDTESAAQAKKLVEHGDICALSIYANQLKQRGSDVYHGMIREVSLVLAGANPEAFIDDVIAHSDDVDGEAAIYTNNDGDIELYHADEQKDDSKESDKTVKDIFDSFTDEEKQAVYYMVGVATGTDTSDDAGDAAEHSETSDEKNVGEVFDNMTEEKKKVAYAIIGMAVTEANDETAEHSDDIDDDKETEGGDNSMKHNVFDKESMQGAEVLSHSDLEAIVSLAKQNNVGSLQTAIQMYAAEHNAMAHGIDEIETLFPEYKDVKPGAPDLLERDMDWVAHVMRGTHKSPISRIRTCQADARAAELRAHGYKDKGDEKVVSGNIKLLKRTTDPQTIYRKDAMHRDDIIDITDFDVVDYQWGIMRRNLEEEIARAILIGDGREEGDEMKISEEHVRSILNDDDLYAIHNDVDIKTVRSELQGTDTNANFGENYIYAEAIITAALYSREKYKGSGSLEFYCTPHLLNVMLLARDLNGRRIYTSKADLAAALNVKAIHTVEQFEGVVRTDKKLNKHKLLGIFVNLNDYQIGSTKGGEITKFDDFDIDFNQYKYLIETRLSGALTKVYSAIVLEEPVVAE